MLYDLNCDQYCWVYANVKSYFEIIVCVTDEFSQPCSFHNMYKQEDLRDTKAG